MTPRQNAVALFLFGLGANIYAHIMGYLAFSEIALFIVLPVMMIWRGFDWKESKIRLCLALLVVWLGSALLTDYLQGTFWLDALRGESRPVFLGGAMIVLYQLLRPDPRAAGWFYFGLIISNTIGMFAFKPGSIDVTEQFYDITIVGDFSKQGIAIVLSVVPCLLFWKGARYPTMAGILCIVLGLVSVFFGSRSTGGTILVSGLIIIVTQPFLHGKAERFRLSIGSISLVVLAGGIGVLGLVEVYKIAASKGWLGEAASTKYFQQTQNRFGLLLGGRMDFLSGVLAVEDSPFIGHGSWPMDTKGYMLHAAEIANADLDPGYQKDLAAGLVRIPAHSQILEPWVEHGFLATLFWWYIVWLLLRCSLQGLFVRPELFPAAILLLLSRWWDLLFSPFGARVVVGAAFAFFVVLIDLVDKDEKYPTTDQPDLGQISKPRALVQRPQFYRENR
jgi:hypothetical protein